MYGSILDVMHKLGRSFSESEIAALLDFVLQGLRYLHNLRFIHRDIKSQNILIGSNGEPKLADFGVSRHLEEGQSAQTVIGTPLFMSPEILLGEPYDYSTDIWSIGITTLQLADELPYSGLPAVSAIFKIIMEPPPKFKQPSKFSPDCDKFLEDCLQTKSHLRPNPHDLLNYAFFTNSKFRSDQVVSELLRELHPGGNSDLRSTSSLNTVPINFYSDQKSHSRVSHSPIPILSPRDKHSSTF